MSEVYKHKCPDCGFETTRNSKCDHIFCRDCKEKVEASEHEKMTLYKIIIEVDGSINHKGRTINVSGVTGREAVGNTESEAKKEAVKEFKENPGYNTDISVNKSKFPDGRYLDDWGYKSRTARAIDAVPREEYTPMSVKWEDRGLHYCTWEQSQI